MEFSKFIIMAVLIILPMNEIYPQETGSSVPISDICRSMMTFHQKNKFDSIKDAMPYLEPFLDSLQKELNINLHKAMVKAIRSEDPDAFVLSLRKVILCDIYLVSKHVISSLDTADIGKMKAWHKISYFQYHTLVTGAESRKSFFKINRRIKKAYQIGYKQLGRISPYRSGSDTGGRRQRRGACARARPPARPRPGCPSPG